MEFINKYLCSDNIFEKIALLFRSHNEHYLVFPRLLSIGILKIAGEINFVWLNILGCLALLVYPYVVWASVHVPNSRRLLLLLCVCLMIFHPLYVEATLWATAAVSNLWVVGFVLLSFLYAQKNGFYFTFLTFFYGLMATFTLGSGVLEFVILGLIFLNSERYIKGVFSLVLFGILICVMQANSAKAVINKSELGLFDFTLRALDYWITFLGSSLSFYSHSMGLVSGVVFILLFLLLCYLRYDKTNPAVFGLLLFCIFTALVQSLSRSQMNLDFSYTTNRYKIISILAFSSIFVGLIECSQALRIQNLLLKSGTILSAVLWLSSYYYHYKDFEFRKQFLEDSLSRWNTVGAALEYYLPEEASNIMKASIGNGSYKGLHSVKPLDMSTIEPLHVKSKESDNVITSLENTNVSDEYVFVRGWAFLFNKQNEGSTIYLVLSNSKNQYLVSTLKRLRLDVTMHHKIYFNQGNLDNSGFQSLVSKNHIQPGEYNIGVMIKLGKDVSYKQTTSKIKI